MTNEQENNYKLDLESLGGIIGKFVIDPNDKSIDKVNKVILNFIEDKNKNWKYSSQEKRIDDIANLVQEKIVELKQPFSLINKLSFKSFTNDIHLSLSKTMNMADLQSLTFNKSLLKEQNNKYISDIFDKVKQCIDSKDVKLIEEVKAETSGLQNHSLITLGNKITSKHLDLDEPILLELVGKDSIDSMKSIKQIYDTNGIDLTEENVSEQAKILNSAKRGGVNSVDASFAAKVLFAQQMALKGKKLQEFKEENISNEIAKEVGTQKLTKTKDVNKELVPQ